MQVRFDWHGLTVVGVVVKGDSIGDPSVPGGVQELAPYLEDYSVRAPDGSILTHLLSDAAIEEIEALALA